MKSFIFVEKCFQLLCELAKIPVVNKVLSCLVKHTKVLLPKYLCRIEIVLKR